jgi:hypothetical protein
MHGREDEGSSSLVSGKAVNIDMADVISKNI